MGVLWTLVIEVFFYLISAAIGKFSVYKLMLLQAGLLICILLGASNGGYYLGLLGKNSLFILYITIGVGFFLAEREARPEYKIALVLNSVVISYFGFQFYKNNIGSTGTYENLGTHLVVVSIFALLMTLDKLKFFARIPKAVTWLADLVYPMYLFHTALGLATMALARSFFNNHIFMLGSAIFVTIATAWLTHITIEKPFIGIGRRLTRPKPISKE
jgi:peptidoglycan/LPS O-acetylase OafA/YrhL